MSDAISPPAAAVAEPAGTAALPERRRWSQFSLRTILVVMTAASVWLAFHTAAVHRQKGAVAEITRLGGFAFYDYEYEEGNFTDFYRGLIDADSPVPAWLLNLLGRDFFHDVVYLNMAGNPRRIEARVIVHERRENPTDEIRHVLPRLPELRMLVLTNGQATDAAMREVGKLYELEAIHLGGSKMTDEGVAALANLKKLKHVQISGSDLIQSPELVHKEDGTIDYELSKFSGFAPTITDESLRIFGQMDQLELLAVGYNDISDDGVAHLKNLTRLRILSLDAGLADLTDAGLRSLHGMTELEYVSICYCNVTDAGLAELRRALPNLKRIDREFIAPNRRNQ